MIVTLQKNVSKIIIILRTFSNSISLVLSFPQSKLNPVLFWFVYKEQMGVEMQGDILHSCDDYGDEHGSDASQHKRCTWVHSINHQN